MLLMDNTISNPLNSQQLASSNVKTHSVEGEKYVVANKTSSQPAPEETDSPVDDTASLDSNSSSKKDISPRAVIPRTTNARNITVQTLMQEGLLEPGAEVLSIDYLGKKFFGDLLPNGKIMWENSQFASPSSWATFIKKRLNPSKKSGSGWNSVKYKGKKLDKIKSSWVQKNCPPAIVNRPTSGASPAVIANDDNSNHSADIKSTFDRNTIKASDMRNINNMDPNTQISFEHFSDAKPQPFTIVISSTVSAVVDFHCHMSTNEVVGYLGGKYDPSKKCLYIFQAFPCRCQLYDQDVACAMEQEINNSMMVKGLSRVGWYHSHPTTRPVPTLRDTDVQHEMQMQLRGNHPFVGLICDPYFSCDASRPDSVCALFMTNSSALNHDLAIPLKLSYNEMNDPNYPQEVVQEFNHLINFYKHQNELVSLTSIWKGTMTYKDKIRTCLQRKIMKEKSGEQLFICVCNMLESVTASAHTA